MSDQKKDRSDEDTVSSSKPPQQSQQPEESSNDEEGTSGFGSMLTNLLSKLTIGSSSERDNSTSVSGGKQQMTVLDEASIEGVKRYIESGRCKNVIVMAGAGISTSAGIPDFRSPGSGIYENVMKKYHLMDPQLIFEIGYFQKKPKPFYSLAKELFPESFAPTLSHNFIRLLHEKGLLLRHYTQNIDGLERKVGLPDDKIVEAHGTFYTSHCLNGQCGEEYSFEWIKEKIMSDEVPRCTKCDMVVKPDVVFFGEALPTKFFVCAEEDFHKCDLLIIMGTSLVVQPFASLIDRAPDSCPRLLINREKVGGHNKSLIAALLEKFPGRDDMDLSSLLGKSGLDFEDKSNRDVALLGDCDDGCRKLVEALGWEADFEKLMNTFAKI